MPCLIVTRVFVFFFFFQAEDGIRDLTVTGVQTCALPISSRRISPRPRRRASAAICCASSSPTAARGSHSIHRGSPAAPSGRWSRPRRRRSEEHTSELQSQSNLVCRLLLEKKK